MSIEVQTLLVAVIIAALLFAQRLGTADELPLRLYQVALGFALAFAVTSGTTAFIRPDSPSLAELFGTALGATLGGTPDLSLFEGDAANKSREAASIQSGIGLGLLLVGLLTLKRLRVLPLGLALAGLLLLLVGGSSGGFDPGSMFSSGIFGTLFGATAEKSRDIIHFAVLAIGAAILLAFGYWNWERQSPSAATTE